MSGEGEVHSLEEKERDIVGRRRATQSEEGEGYIQEKERNLVWRRRGTQSGEGERDRVVRRKGTQSREGERQSRDKDRTQ